MTMLNTFIMQILLALQRISRKVRKFKECDKKFDQKRVKKVGCTEQ